MVIAAVAVAAAARLEYWTPKTHTLCHPARRAWVHFVLLVLNRLELPIILHQKVVEMLKRHELGPPALMEIHYDGAGGS